jgi:hypothetical protein
MGLKPRAVDAAFAPFLAQLPAEARRLAREVLVAPARYESRATLARALKAVGFDRQEEWSAEQRVRRAIPLPEALTPSQRALAEIASRLDPVRIDGYTIPSHGWCRRRWLGRDPRGVLEREVAFDDDKVPLWRALSLLWVRGDEGAAKALVARLGLSRPERLELFADLVHGAYNLEAKHHFEYGPRGREAMPLADIDASCVEWARATIARWSRWSRFDDGHVAAPPYELCWPVMAALTRSKIAMTGDAAKFLLVTFQPAEYVELGRQALRLFPEAERDALLLERVQGMPATYGFRAAFALLEDFPSEALVEFMLSVCDEIGGKSKREIAQELAELAATIPEVRRPLARFRGEQPPEIELARIRTFEPSQSDELTPGQKEQLRHAGMLWDGQDCPAADRLSDDGAANHGSGQVQSFRGFLKVIEIADASGKHAYDAYLYMVDSGAIFRAGTTDVVAQIIQRGLQCSDLALKEALQVVLEGR